MSSKHKQTPILTEICKRSERDIISFQTPGHNNGLGFDARTRKLFEKNYLRMDVSVCGTVDAIDHPKSFIKKSQDLLTDAYKSKRSYFLVNGSSMGNMIMFLSQFKKGDKVILPRNIHKSALSSIIISGVRPIWIKPEISNQKNLIYNLLASQIESAIKQHPDVKGVFIVSPTYHGITPDLARIRKITRKYKKLLLVDEAWGAHLRFHPDFPSSATEVGADMVVQSFHKMLPTFNQGSVLHAYNDINLQNVEDTINLLQTTSPSYPLLASMDYARSSMMINGRKHLDHILNKSRALISDLEETSGYHCLKKSDLSSRYDEFDLDPAKITIFTNNIGITGYELEQKLEKECNIQVECSNYDNIVIILKQNVTTKNLNSLLYHLYRIGKEQKKKKLKLKFDFNLFTNEQVMDPGEAYFMKSKIIELEEAQGRICGEVITVYPPGIPVLLPGERISKEMIRYIKAVKSKHGSISASDNNCARIKVLDI